MSIIRNRIVILLILGIFVGAAIAFVVRPKSFSPNIAKHSSDKIQSFRPRQLLMTKPGQTLAAQINLNSDFASDDTTEVRLLGKIQAFGAIDSVLAYQWILPAGVSLVQGNRRGFVQGLQEGQTQEFEIVVKGFSSEGMPRSIQLEISGERRGTLIGTTASINTHPMRADLMLTYRPNHQQNQNHFDTEDSDNREPASVLEENPYATPKEELPMMPKGVHL